MDDKLSQLISLRNAVQHDGSGLAVGDFPERIVAAWHGHDPAVLLSIYSDAKADELRAASASLFG